MPINITTPTFCLPLDAPNDQTTLAVAYTVGAGTVQVATGTGVFFQAATPSAPIRLTAKRLSDGSTTHLKVSSVTGDTLTVQVADGYSDIALNPGDVLACNVSAPFFTDLYPPILACVQGVNQLATEGVQGPQGSKGSTGSQGPQGAIGSTGQAGSQGSQGASVQGATGSQGPQGANGTNGSNGANGSQGPQGSQGNQGSQGATGTGTQGPQGSSSGGGGSPGGSNGEIQFNSSSTFAGSGNLNWDNTNSRLGINTTSPGCPLHVSCVPSHPSFLMTGNDIFGTSTDTGGVAIALTYNNPGNRQLCFFDSAQIGTSTYHGFRYIVGFPIPFIDAIAADNSSNGNLCIGQSGTLVGMGFSVGQPQSAIQAQLHVQSQSASVPIQINQQTSGQYGDFLQFRNASGTLLGTFDAHGAYSLPQIPDSTANPGTLYYSTTSSKLTYKDPSGTVHNLY